MRSVSAKPLAVADSDTVLVERARRGDEPAFQAIYSRYARYIAGVVYRFVGSDAELEDIVQDTFIAAARSLAKLEEPHHLRVWLVKIAVRRAGRYLAVNARRRELTNEIRRSGLTPTVSDPVELRNIYAALSELPVRLRLPWTLHRVEEMTLPEVSKVCGRSLATVKRRIAEAERRLKKRISS